MKVAIKILPRKEVLDSQGRTVQNALKENGFTTVDNIYSDKEIEQILCTIDQADNEKETFFNHDARLFHNKHHKLL